MNHAYNCHSNPALNINCVHLALYRQEQICMRRHQVQSPRQTLARWVALAADWRKPIYEQIRTGVLAGGYVQIDSTPERRKVTIQTDRVLDPAVLTRHRCWSSHPIWEKSSPRNGGVHRRPGPS